MLEVRAEGRKPPPPANVRPLTCSSACGIACQTGRPGFSYASSIAPLAQPRCLRGWLRQRSEMKFLRLPRDPLPDSS